MFNQSSILEYWQAVEFFTPQNVPRPAPNDSFEPVFTVSEGQLLPWNPRHRISQQLRPKTVRRFVVYGGVFRLDRVRQIVEEAFGSDSECFDERTDGENCFFAFSVSNDGRPLFETLILSTCAWATSRTLNPGPDSPQWLVGFDVAAEKLVNDFSNRYAIRPDDEIGQQLLSKGYSVGCPLEFSDLLREVKRIGAEMGILHLSESIEIRIRAFSVATSKNYAADNQDFLNSFFIRDLAKVADEVRRGNLGKGLDTFLQSDGELNLANRIDVRKSISPLFLQLEPLLFPAGRWPSYGHHPLVLGQQFAVNAIFQSLKQDAGLFAVNGPPGTGKTTLLRDLIAAVVVERATLLAQLPTPDAAFARQLCWMTNGYRRTISIWDQRISGHEIVIASNNNGAVENVTLEIPAQAAIDPDWVDQIDYFADFGFRLIDAPAWALIAARLGNKTNRRDFINRFWFGSNKKDSVGFLSLLKKFEESPKDGWAAAVTRFNQALAAEQRLRDEHERIFQSFLSYYKLRQERTLLKTTLQDLERKHQSKRLELTEQQAVENQCARVLAESRGRRLEHRQYRPGFWEIIFSLGRSFRKWLAKDQTLAESVDLAEDKLSAALEQAKLCQREADGLLLEIRRVTNLREQNQRALSSVSALLERAKAKYGEHFPIPEQWVEKPSEMELSSPWADPAWNSARAKVFIEALHLHQAFIWNNARVIQQNLQATMDVLEGAVPQTASTEAVKAAWTTLFFVIPVVSTTFASFDRLFSHLGREDLGWLLIDEAGQAVPQAAAGAIWRSRRTVVIGDPLQLEPVVSIPFTVQQALRRYCQVTETWVPGTTSVQQLADRVSILGTYLQGLEEPVWIGAPLRVHRRCDQPMFKISNEVAYSGQMVFGTQPQSPLNLPPSRWIHVAAIDSDGHWIPEEGEATKHLLEELLGLGARPDEIFLISPFRMVVRHLRNLADRYDGLQAGTIHTVQGKETPIVILVLGGDPQRPGAKRWASMRPNLLNVAVSRARRRLYVVGNQVLWKEYPYFSVCAAVLTELEELSR